MSSDYWKPNMKTLGVVVALLLDGACTSCRNESYFSSSSPDFRAKAVVFNRNCGATVGDNVQVSILANNASLRDEPGNVFIEDRNTPFAANAPILVKWLSNDELQISFHQSDRIFIQNKICDVWLTMIERRRVKIRYVLI